MCQEKKNNKIKKVLVGIGVVGVVTWLASKNRSQSLEIKRNQKLIEDLNKALYKSYYNLGKSVNELKGCVRK